LQERSTAPRWSRTTKVFLFAGKAKEPLSRSRCRNQADLTVMFRGSSEPVGCDRSQTTDADFRTSRFVGRFDQPNIPDVSVVLDEQFVVVMVVATSQHAASQRRRCLGCDRSSKDGTIG
jgi:hypothetical protein